MKSPMVLMTLMLVANVSLAQEPTELQEDTFYPEEVAEVDLTGMQVVCGYSDVNSDINREMYADNVCSHYGFSESVGHQCGSSIFDKRDDLKVLTVDPKTWRPLVVPFEAEPDRQVGLYKKIFCKRGPQS